MPIRPEMRDRYPREWKVISLWVRVCAGWRCEWCGAAQSEPHPITGSKVVLTVAHVLNDDPADVRPQNLAALCQRCHNGHDAKSRAAGIKQRHNERIGQSDMLGGDAC